MFILLVRAEPLLKILFQSLVLYEELYTDYNSYKTRQGHCLSVIREESNHQ